MAQLLRLCVIALLFLNSAFLVNVYGQSTYLSLSKDTGPNCGALREVAQQLTLVGDTKSVELINALSRKGNSVQVTATRSIFDAGQGAAYYFDGQKVTYQTGTGFVDVIKKDTDGKIAQLHVGQLGKSYKEDVINIAFARGSHLESTASDRSRMKNIRQYDMHFVYSEGKSVLLGHKTHKDRELWQAQIESRNIIGYFDREDNLVELRDDGTEQHTGKTVKDAAYFPVRDLWFGGHQFK